MNRSSTKQPVFDIQRIDAQLAKWRERLIDLTKGNPLLGINRSRVSKLLVKQPELSLLFASIALHGETLKMPLVKRKAKKKKTEDTGENAEEVDQPEYILEPGDIEFDSQPKDLFRLMRRIYDNGKTTVEERGVTTLHLTFGVLSWDDPMLGESTSPLLMVPCQLESHGPNTQCVSR